MNRIYIFTGTGTSLQVAKDISSSLGDTELISIPKLMRDGEWNIEGERVGIVFPCYYGEMPHLVKEFIRNAKSINIEYLFSVVTAGGSFGYSLKRLAEELHSRKCKLDYGGEVIVSSNYIPSRIYKLIRPNNKTLKKNISNAKELCKKFGRDIIVKKKFVPQGKYIHYVLPRLISPTKYVNDTRPWDCEFDVTAECNKCGVCVQVCPVKNIKITEKVPNFSHNCQRCMACIQYCPQSAFSVYGKSMKKNKYTHPSVSLSEIIAFNN